MNNLRLKWKIFAFLLGFCALLLTILWLFQTVLLNDMYKFIRTKELSRVIATVEKEISNPDIQNILLNIQTENDVVITRTQDFVPPQRPGFDARGRRGNPMSEAITETREFTLKDGQTVSMTFYALIVPVNATVTTLRMQLYVVTGVMLVLSVLLAILIAKRVSKPIEDISKSARTLAKGDYDTRFSGKGFYEIVELSGTLNTAAIELGRVEGLRRELMANVSHDLRTPLALIYSYAEMMNDFPGEITQEQTKIIMDETQRLSTLVNDVMDISKMESEIERLNVTRFNLTNDISETIKRVAELLKNEGFEILFRHDCNVYVDADETKIGRTFYNLLINAINYSGESRTITVTQTLKGNHVRISITDYGKGISKEDMPLIWDRYYKSGKDHKRAVTGTGLGLSIVKKIIELHCGNYGVGSDIGKGSTFWFEIGFVEVS
jgi:signal transduction histidine kinase